MEGDLFTSGTTSFREAGEQQGSWSAGKCWRLGSKPGWLRQWKRETRHPPIHMEVSLEVAVSPWLQVLLDSGHGSRFGWVTLSSGLQYYLFPLDLPAVVILWAFSPFSLWLLNWYLFYALNLLCFKYLEWFLFLVYTLTNILRYREN